MLGSNGIGNAFSLTKILEGISKTLNLANQAIPLYVQAKPIISNARNVLKVAKNVLTPEGKNTNKKKSESFTNNKKKTIQPNEMNNPKFFL